MQIPSPRHKRNGIKENHKVDGTIELTIKAFKENRIFLDGAASSGLELHRPAEREPRLLCILYNETLL